ncbi:glycerol-3-phosphate dehydrogenase [Sulfitobacter sp. M57]|uniref:glycerol-3-phosphate dehydrogenase n=1 Tax=unclassified Sulfitobacter TaxID=196795 RepID=UPI0023E16726|nr:MULTISPECIES: glycerol-3-phosphate dehydrogenase [unclassified Sulfitobacter]MDF3415984.1 glycerol-3-phosphate dehydrogenase [Sulfitobacter sp. KE5]MDF3423464.1 glycerol-3-phosphate dehydrogenase [Sulfitobacter sp. KE43]MDF3434530.1 glycerol-3-phosphate dehydrogenase [Sulfitobacter sp. KE42]MDF3460170.1 glycerol-3-phosphate dehydrogenase [Sulfitobacter sp. S74]MDF3464068.1 glycerol-3-phosphate dehydrogenase [Sulfitobacter sp. Ks18]
MRGASLDQRNNNETVDLFVIGGGINGCGIARDAAGRGLRVELAEMNDLASATSSASTKLFHGGLRYLEYWEIRLVREALIERETLLRAMPHISWPMRFVLPYHKDMRFEGDTPTSKVLSFVMPWMRGRRPAWLVRLGLFMYDNLGGRKILKGTTSISLSGTPEGAPLQDRFEKAYEYSDCWIEDSRLVVLNARDAEDRGARINVRTKVVSAEQIAGQWRITLEDKDTGDQRVVTARMLVNAGGPWVEDVIRNTVRINASEGVRLVRGSHIVTHKLYDHDKCYFFQGTDGRIIFTIPYESDFTLIGTTDAEHQDVNAKPVCTPEEQDYLIDFASKYLKADVSKDDIIWTYSGVRPLYDDGATSATAATRDYVLTLDQSAGAPILNVFGGKITTYRRLAESALEKIVPFFSQDDKPWTAGVPLPGGDFPVDGVSALIVQIKGQYPFLDDRWATRLVKAYGRDVFEVLGDAQTAEDLGQCFGANLTEFEVLWLVEKEFARCADDILWRRSKLGLRMTAQEVELLEKWMAQALAMPRQIEKGRA